MTEKPPISQLFELKVTIVSAFLTEIILCDKHAGADNDLAKGFTYKLDGDGSVYDTKEMAASRETASEGYEAILAVIMNRGYTRLEALEFCLNATTSPDTSKLVRGNRKVS